MAISVLSLQRNPTMNGYYAGATSWKSIPNFCWNIDCKDAWWIYKKKQKTQNPIMRTVLWSQKQVYWEIKCDENIAGSPGQNSGHKRKLIFDLIPRWDYGGHYEEQVTSEGSRSSILYGDYQLLLFPKWGIDKWILLHFVFVCLRPCRGFIRSKGGTLLKGSFQISSVIKFNVNTLGFDAYK